MHAVQLHPRPGCACLLQTRCCLLRLQLLPVPSQESAAHPCSATCQCLHCALCPLPLAYYYSIPYVNTVTRTGHPRVLCSDSMASPVYRNTLTEHPTPPLLYAHVVTGHSWGMFLEIDLWGQRAYVLSRRAVPLVAIPQRLVLRDTHAT